MADPTPAPADPVAAYLAEVRERLEDLGYTEERGGVMTSGLDARRLLRAVVAALALAAKWEAPFGVYEVMNIHEEHAMALRQAISRELLEEESDHA
jgi:hypothetical protein